MTSTYDANNRLLKSKPLSAIPTYTYDAAGNRRTVEEPSGDITTSTWDAQNHLVQVELPTSEIVTYTWSPINKTNEERLVQRDDGVDVRRYLWDNNNVLRETDDLGAVETQYTYAPQPYGDLISQQQDGDSTFHQYDALGSTTGLTDESGVLTDTSRYEAFGKPLEETGPVDTPYRWVGQQGYRHDDTTGDYNLRARDYDPQAARFLSQDPLGLDAGDSNFYRYVANSPINRRDPSGLGYFDAGPVNQNTGEYPVYYVIEGWVSDRREHVGFRDLKTDEVIRGVFSNGTGFLYKVHYTAVQALLQNPVTAVLDKWKKEDWDTWFQQNDPRFKSPQPKPKNNPPAPPLFPQGGQCPLPKKPKYTTPEGGHGQQFLLPEPNMGCGDQGGYQGCESRALTKADRDKIQAALDQIKHPFAFAAGFVPVLGDVLDLAAAIEGKDFVTEEDLGLLERAIAAIAFLIPFFNAQTGRRLLRTLEQVHERLKSSLACVGNSATAQRLLKWLREKILELNLLLSNAGPGIPGNSGGFPTPGPKFRPKLPPYPPLPFSRKLRPPEVETGQRLQQRLKQSLWEDPHGGADFVDASGTTYDAVGVPAVSQYWPFQSKQFMEQIRRHLMEKCNDFTVIDLTGFTPQQIADVVKYLDSLKLPESLRSKIITIGFTWP